MCLSTHPSGHLFTESSTSSAIAWTIDEDWARRDLKLPGSPTGKVLPVFIHASNTTVNFTDVSMSRENPRMLDITIILVKQLIKNLKT